MDDDVDDEMIRDVVDIIEKNPGVDGQLNRSGALAMEESKEWQQSV